MYTVILDTDIGEDIDDVYALSLLLCSPEVRLEAVTVNTGDVDARAHVARRLLDIAGLMKVPVYRGVPSQGHNAETHQALWGKKHQSTGAIADDGVGELVRRAAASPGKITLIAIGPLSNLGAALDIDANFGRNLQQIILMGGSIKDGYHEIGVQSDEYNIIADVAAAQKVFACGAKLTIVPLDATGRLQVTPREMAQLCLAHNPITDAIAEVTACWENSTPTLHDPRACAVIMDEELAEGVEMCVEVTETGTTNQVPGDANCRVIMDPKKEKFFKVAWERYCAGVPSRKFLLPPGNDPPA